MADDGELIASFQVRINLRATANGSVKIPTNAHLEELVIQAIETDSIENGGGDYTVKASAVSERTDK